MPGRGPQFPSPPDRFALLGLLNVIRMKEQDLTTLALGIDLTTLGLNLNSSDELYKTFASPWADQPQRLEPEYRLPVCYIQQAPRLLPSYFSKFKLDTLFYIFYSMPGDAAQVYAARELSERQWMYHKEFKVWLTRVPNSQPSVATDTLERGSFLVYNTNSWAVRRGCCVSSALCVVWGSTQQPCTPGGAQGAGYTVLRADRATAAAAA